MNQVILYYKFNRVEEIERFIADHRRKCKELNLLGRIYISTEGINGTLSGEPADIESYKIFLTSLKGFEDTQFKEDQSEYVPFQKLIVRKRNELATLKPSVEVDVTKESEPHLSPQEWKAKLESKEDFVLLDVRNNYETKIGHFENAVTPDVENFYEFEKWVDNADIKKEKEVLMYCTGGIRCEKFSVLMKKKGFKSIYQLDGGIVNYAKETGGKHFKGKCFVFDDRLAVPVNKEETKPISTCEITGVPCDKYLNCANPDCNKLFICSEEGAHKYEGSCSEACFKTDRRRPFDPENIYAPSLKWHRYYGDKPKKARKVEQSELTNEGKK